MSLKEAKFCTVCRKTQYVKISNRNEPDKNIEASLYELKRQPANSVGYMVPWCIDNLVEHLKNLFRIGFLSD